MGFRYQDRRAMWLFGALLVGAFLHLPVLAMSASCTEIDSCDDCNSATLCHWCGSDQQCHAKGSIHGCIYGTYCYDNDQCEREVPEYHGYAPPSIAVLLGVCLVGGTAIFCAMATLSIAREYANQSAASRASSAYVAPSAPPAAASAPATRSGYMMLSGDDAYDADVGADSDTLSPEAQAEAGAKDKKKAATTGGATAARRISRRRTRRGRGRGRGREAAAPGPGPSPLARKVLGFTRLVAGTGVMAVLVCCTVVVMFAPHAPGVNVCNTEFDWGSIVNSLETISVEADFQILVSIYNPNVLDAEIESGTAIFYHKRTQVGTMVFNPTLLPGGYITDMLLMITINGETWEDARLGLEYETGKLSFLMDATVSASVLWHGLKTYPFTFDIKNYYIKVADAVDYDRSLCNCTQMMQGRRRPQIEPDYDALPGGDEGESDEQVLTLPRVMGDESEGAVQE